MNKTIPLLKHDRILFEGDSLTAGLKNHTARLMGWDRTWAHMVDEWLLLHRPELYLESENLAVGGSSMSEMLLRAGSAEAFKPSIAIFTIGTNDCNMKVPLPAFKKELSEWCVRLRAAGCSRFIHIGGFPPCPNADDSSMEILKNCKPYWSEARKVVVSYGGIQIDAGPYMMSRASALYKRWPGHTVYSCGIHYNAIGNSLIAGAVLSAFGFWK